jgi:hypothetical protein
MPFSSDDAARQTSDLSALEALTSPVLLMLATATGLTGAAADAGQSLRMALDEQVPRIDRLDALGQFTDRLHVVTPEFQTLDRLTQEVFWVVRSSLHGPRLEELRLKCSARSLCIDWSRLISRDWDTDHLGGQAFLSGRALAEWMSSDLVSALRPFWREPLRQHLHDTEEAAAMIRLLRLFVLLTLSTPGCGTPQTTLNDCARALGLWKAVEQHLPEILCSRLGGPAPLYETDDAVVLEATAAEEDPLGTREALSQASLAARQHALHLMTGHADILQAVQPSVEPRPASTSTTLKPASLSIDAAVNTAASTATTASAKALAAHEAVLARCFPAQRLDVLLAHTTCQVITEPIPTMSHREDRLMLASYEGLRSPLPLALLPDGIELEKQILQLHSEFPWATRAIETVTGELLARRRLGAVNVAWAPVLLVGPPGTGKTRLARRLAEVVALPFLPLDVGSTDSRLLTGTSRGWSSGEPSPILRLLRDRHMAQAVVLLDELDKCHARGHMSSNAVPVQAALLGLLEPESSRRWIDSYLQVPCDLSRMLYIATANRLGTIETALMSRLQPVLVPPPQRGHYPGIVHQVVRDIARDWGLSPEAMPTLEVSEITRAAGSVRELVRLVRQEIVREVTTGGAPH